ncbi:hypothetical protein [Methylomagnum ishizawai]|uniref:hypothetical protein n=1 Tax=Methylomagnum ishizawai TaxID=1760988 RepID=UPI001C32A622|nr:hypothetical protein [Methylomagnum ishizawai]BBL73317.1 hypothetical protein MishRS11D_04150 [Methylomagnum ishizawai]
MANIIGQVLGSIRGLFGGSPGVPPAPAPVAAEAQPEAAQLTGVAKYLAQLAAEEAAAQGPVVVEFDTGVGRYVAALAENPAPAQGTGVQRYLANLAAETAVSGETEADRAAAAAYRARAGGKTGVANYLGGLGLPEVPVVVKKTRVEQYLANLAASSAPVPAAAEATPAEAAVPAEAPEAVAEPEAAVAAEAPAASGLVDLSTGAKQCQASTLKGTQCRNTSGLERIQRTIEGKAYQFLACAHHVGESFKPYGGVLGG